MINKDIMTTLAEVIGASLIIYGVYNINASLGIVTAGIFLLVGSYLISK